jgi:hypothetical protein
MSRCAVFAYASLVNPASAAETLERDVELISARLRGWRRRWSIARDNLSAEKTFARADDGSLPRYCHGLNLEPAVADDEPPNGALLPVTEAELDRLDHRELRYDRIELGAAIDRLPAGIDAVFAYVAKPERYAPSPRPGAVILAPYLETVEAAFDGLGDGEFEAFRRTTGPPLVPVIDAVLIRDEIPPGNPRRW